MEKQLLTEVMRMSKTLGENTGVLRSHSEQLMKIDSKLNGMTMAHQQYLEQELKKDRELRAREIDELKKLIPKCALDCDQVDQVNHFLEERKEKKEDDREIAMDTKKNIISNVLSGLIGGLMGWVLTKLGIRP